MKRNLPARLAVSLCLSLAATACVCAQTADSTEAASPLKSSSFLPTVPDADGATANFLLAPPESVFSFDEPRARAEGSIDAYNIQRNRWEISSGYTLVEFRSRPITTSASGINTSVGYHVRRWMAVEGDFTAAFGPQIFDQEHTKYAFYGGGVHFLEPGWGWRPFAHVLVGGVHMLPQTSGGSQSGLAELGGGGMDYRWASRFSIRLEADYVRSQLYSQTQNNFQFFVGFSLRP
jgi:hypothetical protein